MYCKKCGTELSDDSKFCNQCGEPVAVDRFTYTEENMPCPKCHSRNTVVKSQKVKIGCLTYVGLIVAMGVFGLGLAGFDGMMIGLIGGMVLSFVFSCMLTDAQESVITCQSCGYTAKVKQYRNRR